VRLGLNTNLESEVSRDVNGSVDGAVDYHSEGNLDSIIREDVDVNEDCERPNVSRAEALRSKSAC
jgi:hypothetical protein